MKLSIITINKNNLYGLERTLNSIASQENKDFELVVVDGGSTDGSRSLLGRYSNIIGYSISEVDRGVYHAMNKGIKHSSGDYCLFLNSGDVLVESSVTNMIIQSLDDQVDILYSDVILVNKSYRKISRSPKNISVGFFLVNTLNHQNTVIKRSLLLQEGGYREDLKVASDWFFLLKKCSRQRLNFQHLSHPIAEYNLDGFSSQSIGSKLNEVERAACIKELFKDVQPLVEELKIINDTIYGSIVRNGYEGGVLRILLKFYRKIMSIKRYGL